MGMQKSVMNVAAPTLIWMPKKTAKTALMSVQRIIPPTTATAT